MRKYYIQIVGAILSTLYTVYSLVSDMSSIAPNRHWQINALIGLTVFVGFVAWLLIDKQTEINALKGSIRITASPKYLKVKDLPPNKWSIDTVIDFEIWTNIDIHTSDLVLNIVCIRLSTPPWKFWKLWMDLPFHRRVVGIRAINSPYRKDIKYSDSQPFKDTATFRYTGDKALIAWGTTGFLPELVLEINIPKNKKRVFLDKVLYKKGLTNPL